VDTTALPASWSCSNTTVPPSLSGVAGIQIACLSIVVADAISTSSAIIQLPMTVSATSVSGTVLALGLTGSQLFDATNTPVQSTLVVGARILVVFQHS